MAWKPAVALSFLVAGAAVNAEEATGALVDSNAGNGRALQGYSKWSLKPKGGHSLQKHFRKKFAFRRPHGRWVKKHGDDHSDHSGKYSGYERTYSDDEKSKRTKSTYSGSSYTASTNSKGSYSKSGGSKSRSRSPASKGSGYESNHDKVGTHEKPSYGHGYKPKHRLTKSLLKKFFDKQAYDPVTKYGHGYDDDKKSYGGKTAESYSSYSGSTYSSDDSYKSGSVSKHSYKSGYTGKTGSKKDSKNNYETASYKGSYHSNKSGGHVKPSYKKHSILKKLLRAKDHKTVDVDVASYDGSHHSTKSHKTVDINVGPRFGSLKKDSQEKAHNTVDIDVASDDGSHYSTNSHKTVDINVGPHYGSLKKDSHKKAHKTVDIDVASHHGSHHGSHPYGHGSKSSGSKTHGHASVSIRYGSRHPKTFFYKGAHKVVVKAKKPAHGYWKPTAKPTYGSGSYKDAGSTYGHADHEKKHAVIDAGYGAEKEGL